MKGMNNNKKILWALLHIFLNQSMLEEKMFFIAEEVFAIEIFAV